MLAAFAAHLEVMTLLLDNGTDIQQRDKSGCQALHLAVDGASAEAVGLLLSRGADVDSIDATSGWTPLIRCGRNEGAGRVSRVFVFADPHPQ
eukprot:m.134991 g.134991  ORF g.134991 m.134991 type:complete len:92 (+) comp16930_c0_seq4:2064-2339(+)